MVGHFRKDMEDLLLEKYKGGQSVTDPYDLVKEFCIDGVSGACSENQQIPSIERKKEQLRKANEKKNKEL